METGRQICIQSWRNSRPVLVHYEKQIGIGEYVSPMGLRLHPSTLPAGLKCNVGKVLFLRQFRPRLHWKTENQSERHVDIVSILALST